ncbi:MAG: hypothetical protein ACFFDT_09940 [Candidatus Hodarchaeota archaeon]
MATIIDYVVAYFLYFLYNGSLIFAVLVVVIGMMTYFVGKRRNLQLMDFTYNQIDKGSRQKITKYQLVEKSTMGRTYLAEVEPNLPLTNIRIHFALVHRHLILSKIASLIRKRRDYLLFEADPTDKIVHRYQFEILPNYERKSIKALYEMLKHLDTLETQSSKFNEIFVIKVNDLEFFSKILQENSQIIKKIYNQKDHITRISLYPLESPSIRLVAEINEDLKPKFLLDILFDLTNGITSLAKKGYFAKRKSVPRIYRDKTLDKEKKRFDDRYKI